MEHVTIIRALRLARVAPAAALGNVSTLQLGVGNWIGGAFAVVSDPRTAARKVLTEPARPLGCRSRSHRSGRTAVEGPRGNMGARGICGRGDGGGAAGPRFAGAFSGAPGICFADN